MLNFHHTHAALFDELERQGIMNVDIARLTAAVLSAKAIIAAQPSHHQPPEPRSRCANGGCDD